MKTSFSKLGLERNYLYEIVATTYSIEGQNKIPNGSCMGIRFIDNAFLTITPHHTTITYEN